MALFHVCKLPQGKVYLLHMLDKVKTLPELIGLGSTVALGLVFFTVTDPSKVPPAMFIVAFIILGAGWYCVLRLMARLGGLKERLKPFNYRSLLVGGTMIPLLLLALQSIGQLTARDVITLLVFCGGVYFYLSRLRPSGPR